MKLDDADLTALCDVAVNAAKKAGALIESYAGREFAVDDKASGSSAASQIVTEVDLKSQETILTSLGEATAMFDLGLLIEESEDDQTRFEKDYFWCIDPLDGTLPFVKGRPGYSVSIALVSRAGQAVIGVVYDPQTATLYHAVRNGGAFRNGQPWALAAPFDGHYTKVQNGGAVLSACWVLEQAPAYFMKLPKPQEGGGCVWDYAATVCLFQEMGGWARDSYGEALNLNPQDTLFMNRRGVLYASHADIASSVKRSM